MGAMISSVQLKLKSSGSSAPAGPWIYLICFLGIESPLGLFIILPGLSCRGQKSWSSGDGRSTWRWEARPGGALPALPTPLGHPHSHKSIHSHTRSLCPEGPGRSRERQILGGDRDTRPHSSVTLTYNGCEQRSAGKRLWNHGTCLQRLACIKALH